MEIGGKLAFVAFEENSRWYVLGLINGVNAMVSVFSYFNRRFPRYHFFFPDENSNENEKTEKTARSSEWSTHRVVIGPQPDEKPAADQSATRPASRRPITCRLPHRVKWALKVGGWGDSAGKIAQFYTFGRSSAVSDVSIVR